MIYGILIERNEKSKLLLVELLAESIQLLKEDCKEFVFSCTAINIYNVHERKKQVPVLGTYI